MSTTRDVLEEYCVHSKEEYHMLRELVDGCRGCDTLVISSRTSDGGSHFAMSHNDHKKYRAHKCYTHLYRCCGHKDFLDEICESSEMERFLSDVNDSYEFVAYLAAVLLSEFCTGHMYDRLFNTAPFIKISMQNNLYRPYRNAVRGKVTLTSAMSREIPVISPSKLMDLIVCLNCFSRASDITGISRIGIDVASRDIERAIDQGVVVCDAVMGMLATSKDILCKLKKAYQPVSENLEVVFTTEAIRSDSGIFFSILATDQAPESYLVKLKLLEKSQDYPSLQSVSSYADKKYCSHLSAEDVLSMRTSLGADGIEQMLNICARLGIPIFLENTKVYLENPGSMKKSAKK